VYNKNKIYTAPYILLMDSGALGQVAILLHQHNRPNVFSLQLSCVKLRSRFLTTKLTYLTFYNAKSHQSDSY